MHPAEIASLQEFCKHPNWGKALENSEIEVYLFPSSESLQCANGIKSLIEDPNYFIKPTESRWNVKIEELEDLIPTDASRFQTAIQKLFDKIQTRLKDFSGEVFINITGGYKGLVPYLTMVGMLFADRVTVFYLFERSTTVLELPTYPIAFDLLEWRDRRNLLLPFRLGSLLSDQQKEEHWQSLKNSRLRGAVSDTCPYQLTPIGWLMEQKYRMEKSSGISEFGAGSLLLNRFKDKSFVRCLATWIPHWRHLSAGDHIPETVEHGRGHVQRLLELAEQLLMATKLPLTDEQLFVLISSIWLHDLGHSGDYFTFEGVNGLVRDANDYSSSQPYFCFGDPYRVRDYHNFLSYELVKSNKNFLFPKNSHTPNDLALKSIPLICLYHRKRMPVKDSAKVNGNVFVAKGLRDFKEGTEVIEGFSLVVALLRFLDAAENQEERSGSDEYYDVVNWVLDRQANAIDLIEKTSTRPYYALKGLSAFKRTQKGHFDKHRMVRHLFMVREDNPPKEGVFGSRDDNCETIVGIYLAGNCDFDRYNRDEIREHIMREELLGEFDCVKEILPFRIVLYLVEERKPSGKTDKYQLVMTNGICTLKKIWAGESQRSSCAFTETGVLGAHLS
jgi:hypothetical protein